MISFYVPNRNVNVTVTVLGIKIVTKWLLCIKTHTKVITIHPEWDMKVWTKCHGSPAKKCWVISVWRWWACWPAGSNMSQTVGMVEKLLHSEPGRECLSPAACIQIFVCLPQGQSQFQFHMCCHFCPTVKMKPYLSQKKGTSWSFSIIARTIISFLWESVSWSIM